MFGVQRDFARCNLDFFGAQQAAQEREMLDPENSNKCSKEENVLEAVDGVRSSAPTTSSVPPNQTNGSSMSIETPVQVSIFFAGST